MKIALVHDWLETYAGAEKVLEQLILLYPNADLFALVDFIPPQKRAFLHGRKVRTSFIQHMPFARRYFRYYLPLFPLAMWLLNLRAYDLIISDSHCMAKNVCVQHGQRHVCYCHSPIRYAWDMMDTYLQQTNLSRGVQGWLIGRVMAFLRWWDKRGSAGVDVFVANSHFVAQRIMRCYEREAVVIHPPVAVDDFKVGTKREDFYLIASRMVPYKKMDLIVQAFALMPKRKLIVMGDGPEMGRVKMAAEGYENINILGYQPFEVLKDHLQRCKAFVFAAKEDFGIIPVEAMACGAPVIAYGEGGVLDSVVPLGEPNPTGVFYPTQTIEALCEAVDTFESHILDFHPHICRERAEMFVTDVFLRHIRDIMSHQHA